MTRVLLTGGSGFIAAHTLDVLLQRGHSVVTTVRTQEKANKIKEAHPTFGKDKLDFAIVPDISDPNAFETAVVSDPPFEVVLHTASPFHFSISDIQKDLLDPAIVGTTGILKAIKKSAPTVKTVVITSSFAAILNTKKGFGPDVTYSEESFNPISKEEALENPANGYRASKTFAEKAAWDFVEKEKPNFKLATINPPLVFGPIVHYLNSLDGLNTSNQRIRNLIQGQNKDEIPDTGVYIWVDVRDVALAHVKAFEVPEAPGNRFFVTQGYFCNKTIADVARKNFPEYQSALPGPDVKGGDYPPNGVFKINNQKSVDVLGLKYRAFEDCIVDTIKSLKNVGA